MHVLTAFVLILTLMPSAEALSVTLMDGTKIKATDHKRVDLDTIELNTRYGPLQVNVADIAEPAHLKALPAVKAEEPLKIVISNLESGDIQKVYYENGVAIATETISGHRVSLDGRIKEGEYLEYSRVNYRGSADERTGGRSFYPWFSVDYFGVSNAFDGWEQDIVDWAASYDPLVNDNSDYRPGLGARFGLSGYRKQDFTMGVSVGYIVGPYTKISLGRDTSPTTYYEITGKARTSFVRIMMEFSQGLSVSKNTKFTVSGGVGVAGGQIEITADEHTQSGHVWSGSYYANWFGPSMDVSAGFALPFDKDIIEIGVRSSFFPSQKDFPRFKWSPVGAYFKATF